MTAVLYRSALCVASLVPSVASAQTAIAAGSDLQSSATSGGTEVSLTDIVVTAQRRAENLQRVPVAITAVTGPALAERGVARTIELGTVVSGLNIRATNSSFQPTIRGIGTSATFAENPTSLYIDGVYIPQQVGALRDLNDVAQVAVLKGPQGTLFGRNSTAGVIQITTRAPSHVFHAEVGAEIDDYATFRTDGYVTGGLGPTLAASLSVQYGSQGTGWGRNRSTGADAGYLDYRYAARGKLLFTPADGTSITLIGEYFKERNIGNALQPYHGTSFTYPGFGPVRSRYDSYANPENSLKVRGHSASVTLEQELGFAKFTSISSMRYVNGANVFDTDGTANPLFLVTIPSQPSRSYTEELQLASSGGGRFTWVVGGFYIHNYVSTRPLNFSLRPPFTPVPARRVDDFKQTTESFAGFGQAAFEFLPGTRLTLGARYTTEKRSLVGSETLTVLLPVPQRPPTTRDTSVSVNKPTFRVALDHQVTPNLLAYISFNTGFKSGGYSLFSPTNPPYLPETVKAYEAGFKSELFDRRVRLNVAAFYNDYTNIQVTQVINNTQNVSNGAKAEIYGLDADFEVRIARGLQASGGLELLHAEFTKFDAAQIATPKPTGGATIVPGSAAGNRLPLAQKLAANLAVDYDTTLSGADLHFNVTGSYQGDYYFEPDNFIRQPSYVTINTSVRVTLPGGRISVAVFGKNLLNNAVISFGSATVNGFTTQYYSPPRTYGVAMRVKL